MKKIFFLVTDLNSGGIENYLLRFLRHYEGKFLPTVICKNGVQGTLLGEYKTIKNIRIIPSGTGYLNPLKFWKFKTFLQREKPDAVVDFAGNFAGLTVFAAKLAGIKKRITFYRGSTNHFDESFVKLAYNNIVNKLVFKYSTVILANSKAAFDFFFQKTDERFEVIYNGINAKEFLSTNEDLRQELNIPQEAFVISNVGRFVESKNHKAVIEVASKLCYENKDIYFLLCGKDVIANLDSLVKQKQLQEQVKLLDFRRDVIKVLNTSNAFYFPSYTEGQPNALIEALFVGLPFVASDIAPIKETIPKESHYLLVNADDTEKASEYLKKIYSDQEFRERANLSKWAIENYDAAKLFNKFYIKL